MKQVITITLNPAIDLTGELNLLQRGEINLIESTTKRPAGKGINVASVLAQLGAKVRATGFLGIDNQEPFQSLFKNQGIGDGFVRVAGETRVNVKLAESNSLVTELNFPSFDVNESALQQLLDALNQYTDENTLVAICGSLPSGMPAEFLFDLIQQLIHRSAGVFVDTSGEALKSALRAKPTLIKPNLSEFEQAVGQPISRHNLGRLVADLNMKTGQSLLITDGENGFATFGQIGNFQCVPPLIKSVNAVGAGDTLMAGLIWGWLQDWQINETLRFASALSAWSVSQHGISVPSSVQIQQLIRQVVLTESAQS